MTDAEYPPGGTPAEIVGTGDQSPAPREISPFELQFGDKVAVYDETDDNYERQGIVVSVPKRPDPDTAVRAGSVFLKPDPTEGDPAAPTVILPAGEFQKKNFDLTENSDGRPPSSPSRYRFVLLERSQAKGGTEDAAPDSE